MSTTPWNYAQIARAWECVAGEIDEARAQHAQKKFATPPPPFAADTPMIPPIRGRAEKNLHGPPPPISQRVVGAKNIDLRFERQQITTIYHNLRHLGNSKLK